MSGAQRARAQDLASRVPMFKVKTFLRQNLFSEEIMPKFYIISRHFLQNNFVPKSPAHMVLICPWKLRLGSLYFRAKIFLDMHLCSGKLIFARTCNKNSNFLTKKGKSQEPCTMACKTGPGDLIISLFTWSKQRRLFWRAGFYPANQSNLKSLQKALIGWIKAGLPKSHFCFDHVNRL